MGSNVKILVGLVIYVINPLYSYRGTVPTARIIMTVALAVKVNEGVILAADSAATFFGVDKKSGHRGALKVYQNANKIANLHRKLPVGCVAFGQAGIDKELITTLLKDLRYSLMQVKTQGGLDIDNYTVEEIANRMREFIFEKKYLPAYNNEDSGPLLGFIIAGYSSGKGLPEVWELSMDQGKCTGPELRQKEEDAGCTWNGEKEPIFRIIMGVSQGMPLALKHLGVPDDEIEPAIMRLHQILTVPFINPAMPLQDAIDLANFFVDLTIHFCRFKPGAETVGGAIDLAAITKHEGFKWIQRKHYYDQVLNPHEV